MRLSEPFSAILLRAKLARKAVEVCLSVHSALARGHLKIALALACAMAVAACSMGSGRRLSKQEKDEFLGAPTSAVESQPLGGPAASGDQIGSGPTRVGLIVPLTQGSGPSVVGAST